MPANNTIQSSGEGNLRADTVRPRRAYYCRRGHNLSITRRCHDSKTPYCCECRKIREAELLLADPDRNWRNNRKYRLRSEYGLSMADYEAMLEAQGGACATCGTKEWGKHGPCIDHCHGTGKVRGILCVDCNSGIRCESPEILRARADYLERGGHEWACRVLAVPRI